MLLPIEVQSSVVFKSGSRSEDATEATASARTLRKLHHISEAGPIEFSPDYVAGDSIMSIKIGLGSTSSRALQYNIRCGKRRVQRIKGCSIYDAGREGSSE